MYPISNDAIDRTSVTLEYISLIDLKLSKDAGDYCSQLPKTSYDVNATPMFVTYTTGRNGVGTGGILLPFVETELRENGVSAEVHGFRKADSSTSGMGTEDKSYKKWWTSFVSWGKQHGIEVEK